MIRLARGALFTLAVAMSCAQAHAASANSSKRLSAIACKSQVCQLTVRVEGDCGITVEPEWLFVTGSNVQLVFDILPAGYYFHPSEGIRFKDEYNPEWRSEFFEQGKEGGDIFLSDGQRVPRSSRQSVWQDLNSRRGVFRYSVTVVNAKTQQECRADPGVVNDWD